SGADDGDADLGAAREREIGDATLGPHQDLALRKQPRPIHDPAAHIASATAARPATPTFGSGFPLASDAVPPPRNPARRRRNRTLALPRQRAGAANTGLRERP